MRYNPIICALDTSDLAQAVKWTEDTKNSVGMVKVGLQLFTSVGLVGLSAISMRSDVFLDLKFHDIPNTVYKTVINFSKFSNIKMLTVHGSGDINMIQAAKEGAGSIDVIAVTVLTSSKSDRTIKKKVKQITEKALNQGAAGVVCSANEVKSLRKTFGNDFKIVVPGIRPDWYEKKDDQSRVGTPVQAIKDGASHLVIGRPITSSIGARDSSYKIMVEIKNEIR